MEGVSAWRAADADSAGEGLLEALAWVAGELSEAHGLDDTLQRIVDLGEAFLEHCDGASLMLIHKGGISSPAYSSRVALASDQAQFDTDEGPCLESIRERATVMIDDLQSEERWPDYRRVALELGVRSMISFRLFRVEDTMGALNLYSKRPHAFNERSRLVGQVFASHAAVAMKAAITETSLESAIRSRDLIGQAKGIVMERERLTAEAAFARLRELSQHHNRPLREIAEDITTSGSIPHR